MVSIHKYKEGFQNKFKTEIQPLKMVILSCARPQIAYSTVSPLYMNLQTVNFQRCECGFTCPVHMAGVVTCASSTSGCAFQYFSVLYRVGFTGSSDGKESA